MTVDPETSGMTAEEIAEYENPVYEDPLPDGEDLEFDQIKEPPTDIPDSPIQADPFDASDAPFDDDDEDGDE